MKLLDSWLESRKARVVVDGACSQELALTNQVYQGTVLAPPLWNTYFADARSVAVEDNFEDMFFADDFNLYKAFLASTANDLVTQSLDERQEALHVWGERNQVQFDAAKESKHILHKKHPQGEDFKILGVL